MNADYSKVREYRGCVIWPKNYAGMYSSRVDGYGQVAADTLAGMREMIRYALKVGGRWPRIG